MPDHVHMLLSIPGRQPHHPPLAERFEPAPAAPDNQTPVEAMAHRLKTPRGRALYALRKQTPEPVFGIIKSVLGFRRASFWTQQALARKPKLRMRRKPLGKTCVRKRRMNSLASSVIALDLFWAR